MSIDLDITVTDQERRIFRRPVGGKEVIDLWIQSPIASFNHDRNGLVREFLFNLPGNLIGRVVLILEGADDFIFGVILKAKTFEVIEEIVLQPFQGLED